MTETVDEKNKRLLKAGFVFFERLAKDPENNMLSNAIAVGRLIKETEDRVAAEHIARIRQLEDALRLIAHTFTEDSHGNTKTMDASYYQSIARRSLGEQP